MKLYNIASTRKLKSGIASMYWHISFLPYDAFGISAACVPAIYQEYGESVPAILHIP